jgi:hypothetical protein
MYIMKKATLFIAVISLLATSCATRVQKGVGVVQGVKISDLPEAPAVCEQCWIPLVSHGKTYKLSIKYLKGKG